jgi:hypothetical protein
MACRRDDRAQHAEARASTTIKSDGAYAFGVLSASDDTYLSGYWQSERYFVDAADVIRRDFTFPPLSAARFIRATPTRSRRASSPKGRMAPPRPKPTRFSVIGASP